LQADGWWLRQDIIWHKPNPMPESVTDRCTKAHEYVFLLSKSAHYFYDGEAIKEPAEEDSYRRYEYSFTTIEGRTGKASTDVAYSTKTTRQKDGQERFRNLRGRNKRSVWSIVTEPWTGEGEHFAMFPTALVKPCILAGTSARGVCPKCGAPWERIVEKPTPAMGIFCKYKRKPKEAASGFCTAGVQHGSGQRYQNWLNEHPTMTVGWQPTCDCSLNPSPPVPATILDPFAGSGTVGQVALELGRSAILIELNPDYLPLIKTRTTVTPGLPLS